MTRNVRMLHTAMPEYFSEKRRKEAQLRDEAQTDQDHAMQMLGGLLVLGLVGTAVLLVLSVQQGWW